MIVVYVMILKCGNQKQVQHPHKPKLTINITGEINMDIVTRKIKSQQTTLYTYNIYEASDWKYFMMHVNNNETLMEQR